MPKFLLITAHPDDECMFFTPTIRNLIRNGGQVDLVCLSTGDFDGKGGIRRRELEKSARVLGITSLFIVEDEHLKDGPNNIWKPETILKQIRSLNPEEYAAIVTFDDYGVSGHPNHCSISEALKHQSDFQVLRLKSLPAWLKYLGCLGGALCRFMYAEEGVLHEISAREAYEFGYKAMLKHESQLLWFRRLYLIFSVYMTGNIIVNKRQRP